WLELLFAYAYTLSHDFRIKANYWLFARLYQVGFPPTIYVQPNWRTTYCYYTQMNGVFIL
ncbi:MAG: hypothetical protein K9L26_04755, partial [Candidatus Izimaplasma sp.]|nr:hypothetical protein [Candidatus Izimaplasma bacterium]